MNSHNECKPQGPLRPNTGDGFDIFDTVLLEAVCVRLLRVTTTRVEVLNRCFIDILLLFLDVVGHIEKLQVRKKVVGRDGRDIAAWSIRNIYDFPYFSNQGKDFLPP